MKELTKIYVQDNEDPSLFSKSDTLDKKKKTSREVTAH